MGREVMWQCRVDNAFSEGARSEEPPAVNGRCIIFEAWRKQQSRQLSRVSPFWYGRSMKTTIVESVKQVEEEAAAWIVRRDSGTWTIRDEGALHDWLESSTAHVVAFIRLDTLWQQLTVKMPPTDVRGDHRAQLNTLGPACGVDRPCARDVHLCVSP
jgi:hypothetical protein